MIHLARLTVDSAAERGEKSCQDVAEHEDTYYFDVLSP